MRHGETGWNSEGRAQGQSDIPLNDVGRSQAGRARDRLAPVPFSVAYSSDMRRVVETAEIILGGQNLSLEKLPQLREKSYGEWEGLTAEQVEERYPGEYARLLADNITFAPSGGESDVQLVDRVRPVAARIMSEHPGDENVLIVGHGGSLRALLICLLDLPIHLLWRFRLANVSISVLSTFSQHMTVELWNDTSHLGT